MFQCFCISTLKTWCESKSYQLIFNSEARGNNSCFEFGCICLPLKLVKWSCRSGLWTRSTTWWWVHNEWMFIFGWTVPLRGQHAAAHSECVCVCLHKCWVSGSDSVVKYFWMHIWENTYRWGLVGESFLKDTKSFSVSDKMILLVFINTNCRLSLKGWINNTEEEQQQKTGEIVNKSALVFWCLMWNWAGLFCSDKKPSDCVQCDVTMTWHVCVDPEVFLPWSPAAGLSCPVLLEP